MKKHLIALLLGVAGFCAHAEYPDKPIRLVVPFATGQSADVLSRFVADRLKDKLGQPVVVDNRPGASGIVATQALLAAPADGYTLMLQSLSIAIVPSITKVNFDVLKDLQPIARLSVAPAVFIVGANSPYHGMAEFIEGARKNPGRLSCATFGVGSPPHVALEMLNGAAGIQILHVPYRTSTLTDLVSGVIDCAVETPASALVHAQGKTGRALGVSTRSALPSVPSATPIAASYPGTEIESWIGVFASAGTPPAVTKRIEASINDIVRDPAFEKLNATMGLSPVQADNARTFGKDFQDEFQRFRTVVHNRKIVMN